MIILKTICAGMGLGGMDCESYPRQTVKPSFEPQPPSLMPKIRLLKRSGPKYEKNCSYGHGVSGALAKKICIERVHLRTLPVFLARKRLRKIAKNACKKKD